MKNKAFYKQNKSGDSNPDSELESQEQNDLGETQSTLEYNSGYSDPDLDEETQRNLVDSNSTSFFPTQVLQKKSGPFQQFVE